MLKDTFIKWDACFIYHLPEEYLSTKCPKKQQNPFYCICANSAETSPCRADQHTQKRLKCGLNFSALSIDVSCTQNCTEKNALTAVLTLVLFPLMCPVRKTALIEPQLRS